MPIDKVLQGGPAATIEDIEDESVMFPELPSDETDPVVDAAVVEDTEDGGAIVDFGGEEYEGEIGFYENIEPELSDESKAAILGDVSDWVRDDSASRSEWVKGYTNGLKVLGIRMEKRHEPWDNACGAFHPLMAEAAVQFQAQMISEIFPPEGPIKATIAGTPTEEKRKQAKRVADYVNYLLLNKVDGYEDEMDKMLWHLPLAGSAFKKICYDKESNVPRVDFVPSEQIVVPYGAKSLKRAERITHIIDISPNDLRRDMYNGFYSNVDLSDPVKKKNDIEEAYSKITGEEDITGSSGYTLHECHCYLDIEEDKFSSEEIPAPYIVTVLVDSNKIISVRRNWIQGDEKFIKREHFVHYSHIPGFGFYGMGMTHMLGGTASSVTSIMRQLVDAGTLANLPGGWRTKGVKLDNDDTPIGPGEWRDIDVPGGKISDAFFPLPYSEPSNTLFALMKDLVDQGRRFASLNDIHASDMNQQAPVGTTMAIMEKSMKVISAIQKRMHRALTQEAKLIVGVIRNEMGGEYPYELDSNYSLAEDLDDRVDVIPVADPTSASKAQKIMLWQSVLQLAASKPELYDMKLLHRLMLNALGAENPDSIVPDEDEAVIQDPVSENMSILMGEQVKVFYWQDHESHIKVHMNATSDPNIQQLMGQSPSAQSVMSAMSAHVTEHLAHAYRARIEKRLGTPLPKLGEEIPGQIEINLSKLTAEASEAVLQDSMADERAKKKQAEEDDALIAIQKKELEIKEMRETNIAEANRMKNETAEKSAKMKAITDAMEIARKEQIEKANTVLEIIKLFSNENAELSKISTRDATEKAKVASGVLTSLIQSIKSGGNAGGANE